MAFEVATQAEQTAQPGDDVYLGSMLTKLHLWGIVSDLDTPAMMSGSLEVLGDESALVLDALVGPRGPAGVNAPIVKMQWSSSIRDPNDLPRNLLDDEVDRGKAWWIGNVVYVWDGHAFQQRQMGSPGPAGPVPRITPTAELIDPDGLEDTNIEVTGTTTNPSWHMHLKVPRGPAGPAGPIQDSADYEQVARPQDYEPMAADKILTCLEGDAPGQFLWGARTPPLLREVKMFTIPEAAFTNVVGIVQRLNIVSWTVPALPYNWRPWVTGHMKATGVDISTTPLQIGIEVRLNHPTGGPLIGRGHGSNIGWNSIHPHFSHPGDTWLATAPDNSHAVVGAGAQASIHVNLYSEGLAGAYFFNNAGSQLAVLTIPVDI